MLTICHSVSLSLSLCVLSFSKSCGWIPRNFGNSVCLGGASYQDYVVTCELNNDYGSKVL